MLSIAPVTKLLPTTKVTTPPWPLLEESEKFLSEPVGPENFFICGVNLSPVFKAVEKLPVYQVTTV